MGYGRSSRGSQVGNLARSLNNKGEKEIMRIRLTTDLPVSQEHGMSKGAVFDVCEEVVGEKRGQRGWWVKGLVGERIRVFRHEAELIPAGE